MNINESKSRVYSLVSINLLIIRVLVWIFTKNYLLKFIYYEEAKYTRGLFTGTLLGEVKRALVNLEEATKFSEIFTLLFTGTTQDKSKVEISQNCVAFLDFNARKPCDKNHRN